MASAAERRIYLSSDGLLVFENDPNAAFLKYAVGDEVEGNFVDEYEALVHPPAPKSAKVSTKPAKVQDK